MGVRNDLADKIVSAAYTRMENGTADPGDKVVIVLSRNNDNVKMLIRQVSDHTGKPTNLVDRARTAAPLGLGASGLTAVVLALLERLA